MLQGTSAAGLGALLTSPRATALQQGTPGFTALAASVQQNASNVLQGTCSLLPQSIEGPFYLDLNLLRQDITEGKPGLPLTLIFQVVDTNNGCQPIQGAVVDVWHNDAFGSYSGFAVKGTTGETWLRGIQVADFGGLVFFQTIYPGWYPGRTPHIHLKVRPNSSSEVTTQLYFPDFLSKFIHTNIAPYDTNGESPTKNATDGSYTPSTELTWIQNPDGSLSLWAGMIIGVPM